MSARFTVRPITETDARAIVAWRYEEPYALYNFEGEDSSAAVAEMLDGSHYAVDDEQGQLVGFFGFGPTARVPGGLDLSLYGDDALDIGLGLRPDLTGQGLGAAFLESGIALARERLGARALRLSVATFNRRAITVYERAGFAPGPVFPSLVKGQPVDFLLMTLPEGTG